MRREGGAHTDSVRARDPGLRMPSSSGRAINASFAEISDDSVDLHAIDARPVRWRGGVVSSPLDGTSAATSSPSNEHPTLVDFHAG